MNYPLHITVCLLLNIKINKQIKMEINKYNSLVSFK